MHAALAAFDVIVQVVDGDAEIPHQLARRGFKQTPFGAQLHAARVAVKQAGIEFIFQRADQGAEGGLR